MVSGGQQMVSSKWRMVFLEGSAPALPKNFLLFKNCTPHSAHRTDFMVRPPKRRMNSALILLRHQPLTEVSGMENPRLELVCCEQGHDFAAFEFNRCCLASRQLLLRFPEKVGKPHGLSATNLHSHFRHALVRSPKPNDNPVP